MANNTTACRFLAHPLMYTNMICTEKGLAKSTEGREEMRIKQAGLEQAITEDKKMALRNGLCQWHLCFLINYLLQLPRQAPVPTCLLLRLLTPSAPKPRKSTWPKKQGQWINFPFISTHEGNYVDPAESCLIFPTCGAIPDKNQGHECLNFMQFHAYLAKILLF